jgi:hypothetical protein
MSNLYSSKPLSKPLKGGSVSSNYGNFETINAKNLNLESINIPGTFEDGVFANIEIQDSIINNTTIGLDGSSVGYFTELQTKADVTFFSNLPNASVSWNADTGLFYITSEIQVEGCSLLGNIEICNNDIKSVNLNGDVNVSPNGQGSLYVNAPVYNRSSNGSFYSELSKGGVTFLANDSINMYSSHGSVSLTSFGPQTYVAKNGDLSFTVDSSLGLGVLSNVRFTDGNILVTTPLNHNLTTGNIINITNGSLNGVFTVGNILSDTSFKLTTTIASTLTASGGTFIKTPSNSILLNSQNLVKIPSGTELTFGDTRNSVVGSITGIVVSSLSDVEFVLGASNALQIPQSTKIKLGTTGNTYVNFDGSSLNFQSNNDILLGGSLTQINTTNTRIRDPILTIADYTLSSDDLKDRGLEFPYYDTTAGSMKLGWFGFKNTTNLFTFIPDATNTNEIMTGTPGDFELNNLTVTNINLTPGSTINMNCGRLLNASLISGCSNDITITGSTNVTLTATNRIALSSATDVLIPSRIPLRFGTTGSQVSESTNMDLTFTASKNVSILTQTRGAVIVPVDTYIAFDGVSTGNQRISSNTAGDLIVATNKNLYLTTTGGSVIIPRDTSVHLGNSAQSMQGNTGGIRLISANPTSSIDIVSNSNVNLTTSSGNIVLSANTGDILLYPTVGNIRIPSLRQLVFGVSGTSNSIKSSNGNLVVSGSASNALQLTNFNSIDLSAFSSVNIPTSTQLRLGSDNTKYIVSDTTNAVYFTNSASNGQLILSSPSISTTSGTLSVNNQNTVVSSENFVVNGTLFRVDSYNVRVNDPIISIADYNTSTSDAKDRGIEYKYNLAGSMKNGWFGRKDTTGRFTFYSDANNTAEVITGTVGDMEVGSAYIRGSINFMNGGSLDMNCGTIANVSTIVGYNGIVSINGTNSITQNASNILLNADTKVLIPSGIPLSFGSTSSSISATSSGNLTVRASTVVFDSNIQINGTTTSLFSTVTNIQDPIFSLGGITGPVINDNKDRGIEFKWNDNSSSKVGFFGYKQSAERFVFIRDGTNLNEVFSGSYGDVEFNNGYFQNLRLYNGQITGVSEVSGGVVTLKSTSGNIFLTPTQGSTVLIPYNTALSFGTTSNAIRSDTSGNVIYSSSKDTSILASSVTLPENVPLFLGPSYIQYSTTGDLIITNTTGDILLTPQFSSGSVNIPAYTPLTFANTANNIYSDNDRLYINGYNAVDFVAPTVTFTGNINVVGSITATETEFDFNDFILPLGTFQNLIISNISNASGTDGNIAITVTNPHNFVIGDSILIRNTDSDPNVDGNFLVSRILSSTSFKINKPSTTLITNGISGLIKSNLTTPQNKDVGIQVNYWSTTGTPNVTSGTIAFKTGFFGYKSSTERWSFFSNATISNNVVTGTLGNMEANKVFTNRMSGFALDGGISAGSNLISGDSFQIGGGAINNTQIGVTTAQSGRFSTLSNTVSASFQNVSLQSSLIYSLTDKYTLSSGGITNRNPTASTVVSMFSVSGVNYTTSSGTMPSTAVADGTFKVLVCQNMGVGCEHTIYFGPGKLITPNPLNDVSVPTKIVFKRRSQSVQMIFDGTAWILLNSGAYVS